LNSKTQLLISINFFSGEISLGDYNSYSPCSEGTGKTVATLGDVINNNPNSYPYDLKQEGFYLSQQYFLAWYYGTEAYNRLDPQTMSHNSYLVYKFNSMRKDGVDLSKLTVDEVDQMAFDNASLWFKIDTAVLATYITYSAYSMSKGTAGNEIKFGSDTKSTQKLSNQMTQRGWTESTVKDTVSNPYTTRVSVNKATGNSATVYYNKAGGYVIIDDTTKAVVQVSDNINPSTWIPDPSINNPYKP